MAITKCSISGFLRLWRTNAAHRVAMLEFIPKRAVCAEVGIWTDEFSDMPVGQDASSCTSRSVSATVESPLPGMRSSPLTHWSPERT
jgi:hypothetical protein